MQLSLDWRDIERMAAGHLAVIQVGLGCSIVAGGDARFPGPSYSALLDLTGGRAWPYGLVFVFSAIPLLVPHPVWMFAGHILGVIVYNVFSALFFWSMVNHDNASSTAWWAYFALGTLHGFNIALMLVRRKQRLYPELDLGGEGGAGEGP